MQDQLDSNLQSLFLEKRGSLPEEPFLSNVVKLIERHQSRQAFRKKLMLVLGLCICVFFSPLLIKSSILLSGAINQLFALAGNFLNTPTGACAGALCALLVFAIRPRLIRIMSQ
jgi:hypothetical protein